jgi:quercetin dioxygenase-like cupin family protein
VSLLSEILNRRPKRVVTGQRPDGTSYFARVEEVDADFRSDSRAPDRHVDVHRMWANDRLPVELPFLEQSAPLDSNPSPEETPEALRNSTPQPGTPAGLRLSLIKFLPGQGSHDMVAGLHWHDTFDVQWLMAGELTIGLDDGSEETLRPGDAVIQHGTNHSWRVGPDGAVVALIMLGGKRVGVSPPPDRKTDQTPQAIAARRAAARG